SSGNHARPPGGIPYEEEAIKGGTTKRQRNCNISIHIVCSGGTGASLGRVRLVLSGVLPAGKRSSGRLGKWTGAAGLQYPCRRPGGRGAGERDPLGVD